MDRPINPAKALALENYRVLIRAFSSGCIDTTSFEREYLNRFKSEKTLFGGCVYQILNELFCDIDAYCDDPGIRDNNDIDEEELRTRVAIALEKLDSL